MGDSDPQLDALLERAKAGDRPALIELLEACAPRVRGRIVPKITPYLRPFLDEDDVMQVTYLEVVTRFETFTDGDAHGFLSWMSRLAENNLIDAVRMIEADKRPNPRNRVETAGRRGSGRRGDAGARRDDRGDGDDPQRGGGGGGDQIRARRPCSTASPPDYATVIKLYDLQGRSASELAAELNRSEGAIYMLRARAHDRLRDLLPSESKFFSVG
jgi:RNA polymerase sigma factor (sigma-70 family)